ncbi:MAG: zinc ribbon domain-containing protein [Tepidisphaeraceae bacterium]|jgi:hypothetical protein
MSTANAAPFSPTAFSVEPPHRPDALADGVLASLSRRRWGYRGKPWGVIKTAILAFLTLGLAPLICWTRRLRHLMIVEEQQLWHLSEWLALRTGDKRATFLRETTVKDLRPSALTALILIGVPILAILSITQAFASGAFDVPQLWPAVWAWPLETSSGFVVDRAAQFWGQWTLLLAVGYFLHWLEVRRHAAMLRQFAKGFNEITAAEGITPVTGVGVGLGLRPIWLFAAAVGVWCGALWTIPLALAGAVHARYVRGTSRDIRSGLARRVRAMLLTERPILHVRPPPGPSGVHPCINEKCAASLPPDAVFCPRCGSRAV